MLIKLTDERLLKRPRGREILRDKQVPGLQARGGARGWVFGYQGPIIVGADGRPVRQWETLGPWSPVSGAGLNVHGARVRALQLQGKASESVPASVTVRALVEDFLATRYPKNETRRSKVRALLECHALESIGAFPVRAVTRQHCTQLVREALVERRVEEKGSPRRGGRAPAEMLVRVLYQLFRHAEKTGRLEEGRNPAGLLEVRDFGINPARSRDRALSPEEMATLLLHPDIDLPGLLEGKAPPQDGLARLSLSTRAAIILGPHLAVRPIAMLGMRWDEVDLKKGLWTVQGGRGAKLRHHLKAKAKPFAVPLSGTPAAVLGALRKAAGSSPFVLPSESKAGHLTGDVYADALHRLTQRLELAGGPVRPHDARRTFAATATRLGVERYVVDKALQHSLGKIGDTYLVDDSLDRRRAAHVLVDEHWTAVRVGRAAKVVGIRPVP